MVCFAASSPFDDNPASFRAIHKFPYPTSDVTQITKVAMQLANELFHDGIRYYKIGVGLIDLVDGRYAQQDLFNLSPSNDKLMGVFDNLNQKYGRDTLFLGAQGIDKKWDMRRNMLTPQYTSKWQDLPKVRC
ncbi:MAG: DNA polymerase V [Moritella dasanensis]|jgi:DNA polymerase V